MITAMRDHYQLWREGADARDRDAGFCSAIGSAGGGEDHGQGTGSISCG